MTDPGHVGSAGVAPPPFIFSLKTPRATTARRLHVRGRKGEPVQLLGGRLTSKRLAFGSQETPSQSSATEVFSAPESLTIVAIRGSRPARSRSETSVRCRSHM